MAKSEKLKEEKQISEKNENVIEGDNKDNTNQKATPYDDVFRTLVTDCSSLVIPLINEAFGEHYTQNAKITLKANEHYLKHQDGKEEKIITDDSFKITENDVTKNYLLECQSSQDNYMLVRICEYAMQIALDESSLQENVLNVEIPNSAVLYLRSTKNTPADMKICIKACNKTLEIPVKVLKIKGYSVDKLFEKKLYFLIPFYIFIFESKFNKN